MITGNEPMMPVNGCDGLIFEKKDSPLIEAGKVYSGLTIRQYFAAMAMVGLLSCWGKQDNTFKESIECADALISELNKEK